MDIFKTHETKLLVKNTWGEKIKQLIRFLLIWYLTALQNKERLKSNLSNFIEKSSALLSVKSSVHLEKYQLQSNIY